MRRTLILLAHAAVGWALCFATIGIGMALTTERTALVVHAVTAPVYFAGVSAHYFTRFGVTAPVPTAAVFTGFVIATDYLLVALVILRSLEMFTSVLGTWIPFALIFLATWLTGESITRQATRRSTVPTLPSAQDHLGRNRKRGAGEP